ncbi:MAG: ribulose-phosphate 3-epimerase [Eubacteriales bacterium]|nr:ribulose-phosphate 3-epimerase [Eubacteriales bacterium]MDY3332784.1 ribulose-phosphate 3-epimerase [Gallibacter sp.]
MKKIAPSILSADFGYLVRDVKMIEDAGADFIHVDVMDGHFVPNISFGAVVMKSLLGRTKMPFDIHLMIENADKYIPEFVTENTEYITVHQESCVHLDRTIELIKSLGVKAGVSINPATPVCLLENILNKVDLVLVMSVNPGFGGQKFIHNACDKIKELDRIRLENNYNFDIEVDGGISSKNSAMLYDLGANILVAGSAVFKAENPEEEIFNIKNASINC